MPQSCSQHASPIKWDNVILYGQVCPRSRPGPLATGPYVVFQHQSGRYPVQVEGAANRLTVLETKGDQLDNLDTAYKREVLTFLSDNFAWADYIPAGELELVQSNGETVQCTLILMSEWEAKLPDYL